nr:zinc finger, CCHC-type [Tanacetum cinerariifolium]
MIYKPTNNNLRTSSNSRNKSVDMTPHYKNYNQSGQFGNQRTVNVAGARENVGSPVVQQSGIQCFNRKEFGHFAKECRKPKRVKDSAYHKEKMLLCKQAEKGNTVTTVMAITRSIHQATKGLLDKAKGNVSGLEIVRDQNGITLRVSQCMFYNRKLVQTLLEGHYILSLEGSLLGDCDVEKNGKWSYIYAVGSQEYQVVCTRLDIALVGVDMLDGFDRGL